MELPWRFVKVTATKLLPSIALRYTPLFSFTRSLIPSQERQLRSQSQLQDIHLRTQTLSALWNGHRVSSPTPLKSAADSLWYTMSRQLHLLQVPYFLLQSLGLAPCQFFFLPFSFFYILFPVERESVVALLKIKCFSATNCDRVKQKSTASRLGEPKLTPEATAARFTYLLPMRKLSKRKQASERVQHIKLLSKRMNLGRDPFLSSSPSLCVGNTGVGQDSLNPETQSNKLIPKLHLTHFPKLWVAKTLQRKAS